MRVFVSVSRRAFLDYSLAFAQPCQAEDLDSFTFSHVFTSESLKVLFLLDVVFVLKSGLIIQS